MARPEVRLEVVGTCNLRCYYCYNEYLEANGPFGSPSLAQVAELAGIFRQSGLPHVHLTGGEASLRSDLDLLVMQLKQAGIRDVALSSNGSRLTKDYVLRLAKVGLTELHVHLPSLSADVYRLVTRASLTPANAVECALFASQLGIRVRFNTPVSQCNEADIPKILDFGYANRIGVGLIKIESAPDRRVDLKALSLGEVRELFRSWCESSRYSVERDAGYLDFGEPYFVNGWFPVQLLDTSRIHNPRLDNRVWVGATERAFLFSESLDVGAIEVSSEGLHVLLVDKYARQGYRWKETAGAAQRCPRIVEMRPAQSH